MAHVRILRRIRMGRNSGFKGFVAGFTACLLLMLYFNKVHNVTDIPAESSNPKSVRRSPLANVQYFNEQRSASNNVAFDEQLHKQQQKVLSREEIIDKKARIVAGIETPPDTRPIVPTKKELFGHTNKTRGPRILCWIMTVQSSLMTKAVHVHDTWGRRCDKILFFISNGTKSKPEYVPSGHDIKKEGQNISIEMDDYAISNRTLPIVYLDIPEGRKHLTAKTMGAFNYIFRHYLNEFDWFLKADDDTYTVMENLRHFLSNFDTNKPLYFGHHFERLYIINGYNSGGSGYVLSKRALKLFGFHNKHARKYCHQDGEDEDVDMGRCLEFLGVSVGYTADENKATRFVCFEMSLQLMGPLPKWFQRVDAYGARTGIESISRDVISFHKVEPWFMYALEYFVYRFRLRSEDEKPR